jgi:hypothetical protein
LSSPSRQSQIRRLTELLKRNTAPGKTHIIKHQKAHDADIALRPLIQNPTVDVDNQVYVIDATATQALINKATEIQPAATIGGASTTNYDPIHVTLNVCADWAARQVAVEDKTPFHDLGPCAWPPAMYSATDRHGNFIDHTPSTIRKLVIDEAGAHTIHTHIRKQPDDLARRTQKHAIRIKDRTDLWEEESTASLRPPCGNNSEATQRTYIRYMSGTMGFNAERARDKPKLLDVTLNEGGPKLSTKCPFCITNGEEPEDGTDSVEHIMNDCPSTEAQRNLRRGAIIAKLKGLAPDKELLAIANSALRHPDAHAGSVSIQTRDLVRECLEKNDKWKYKTGYIQGILLASTTALVAERTRLIKGVEDHTTSTTHQTPTTTTTTRNLAPRHHQPSHHRAT